MRQSWIKDLGSLWPTPDPGGSEPLLKALHILTRDGALNQDSRRKLNQVLHLVRQIEPLLKRAWERDEAPILADLGAGKSYLGLLLADILFRPWGKGAILAIEEREALCATIANIARETGLTSVRTIAAGIAAAEVQGPVAAVTALHACDTATDDAIAFAIKHDAKVIALVPCCQAEAARQLEAMSDHPLHALWRHPIQRREFGAHITNVIRALFLESHGYKVRVTELTGWEHSLKNELILAERHQRSNPQAKRQLDDLLARLPVRPARLGP